MGEHELWNELGNLYFLSGSYDDAIHAYSKAIALEPDIGEPYNNLAQAWVQIGYYAEAVTYFQQSIQLLTDSREKAASLHKLGEVHLHLKEYPQAVEAYQQAEVLAPDLWQVADVSQPADQLLHCKTKAETLPHGDELAPESSSTSSSGMELLPFIEELTPWWFDGQTIPEEESDPDDDPWPVDELAVARQDENITFTDPLKWDSATAYPAISVETEADGMTVYQTESVAVAAAPDASPISLEVMGTQTEPVWAGPAGAQEQSSCEVETILASPEPPPVMVIADAPEVVTETPEFAAPHMTSPEPVQYESPIKLPAVELSQDERAALQAEIEKLERVLEINPRNAFAWDTLGGNYKTLGQYTEALQAFQEAVRLDSTKAFYLHHLGLVYAAVGRFEDAIAAFERVIEIDPNHSLAHATLGGHYRKNGNEELAQAHIEKARNLLAADENEYNRACLEAICGNTDRSLELLEIALQSKQTYVNWACKDPDLDFVRNDPRFHTLLTKYATRP